MAGHGGIRKGQGRKPIAEELKSYDLCRSALVAKFGSMEAAITYLIESEEPALMKFVYEHAIGKPQDKVDLTTNGKELPSTKEIVFRDYDKP